MEKGEVKRVLDPILSDAKHHIFVRRWCRMPLELQNSTCSLAMLCEGEKNMSSRKREGHMILDGGLYGCIFCVSG